MKKKLTLVVSLLLVMALSIGGTLAYLTAKTDTVINTFTIGKITLNLTEKGAEVGEEEGVLEQSYKIIPGTEVAKEPVLTVVAGSEKCFVYALVENTVKLEDVADATILDINEDIWDVIAVDGDKTLYRYCDPVDVLESEDDWSASVFTTVTYSDAITEENIGDLADKTITIKGFAHQTAGIDDEEVINDAAIDHFGLTVQE